MIKFEEPKKKQRFYTVGYYGDYTVYIYGEEGDVIQSYAGAISNHLKETTESFRDPDPHEAPKTIGQLFGIMGGISQAKDPKNLEVARLVRDLRYQNCNCTTYSIRKQVLGHKGDDRLRVPDVQHQEGCTRYTEE